MDIGAISERSWFNGQMVQTAALKPSIASPTLHLGIGVFDGLMAYWFRGRHRVAMQQVHVRRFLASSERVGLATGFNGRDLAQAIREVLAATPPGDLYVRPMAYHQGPRIYLTPGSKVRADLVVFGMRVATGALRSLRCTVSGVQRVPGAAIPVHCKMNGAYANSYLARAAAEAVGFDDGLLLDAAGRITEASAANVFFLAGSRLVTPSVTPEVFPGATRALVLRLAARLGICAEERTVLPGELAGFDGAFLTATLMEIQPIGTIDDVAYDTVDNQVFRRIRHEFRRLVTAT